MSYLVLGVFFDFRSNWCKMCFVNTIDILSSVLASVIHFSSRKEIYKNIPISFKDFEDKVVVLDCTEIYIPNPNLCCRIRFYFHYKETQ